MEDLNKAEMGRRIRQIRLGAKLRQWELAKLLGTTQSAVHKYEHGVVPEPRRLVALARIGGTSIEWVLTGTHWENGSDEQERLSAELLDTARILREIGVEGRGGVAEALRIVRDALRSMGSPDREEERQLTGKTLDLLESASRIQRAVLQRVSDEARRRLDRAPLFLGRASTDEAEEA
jgi:transcriptional regulator with XRE-family HTH domain